MDRKGFVRRESMVLKAKNTRRGFEKSRAYYAYPHETEERKDICYYTQSGEFD